MKTKTLIGSFILSLFVISAVQAQYKVGDVVSDFSLKNVDSKNVSLAQYSSAKGFIVVFTCNTCPFAMKYESRVEQLNKEFSSKGYPVVAISSNDTQAKPGDSFEEMQKKAKSEAFTFPYLYDESQDVAKRFGASAGVAIRTGLCLTQAGEFGFVLLHQIDGLDWIEPDLLQAVLASMLISMLISPILIQFSDKIALRFSRNEWLNQSLNLTKIASLSVRNENHVIICGFGRSGQNLASMLDLEKIKYIALDLDPDRVQDAAEAGSSVVYGDAQQATALNAAGIARAKAIVVTFNNTSTAMRVLNQVELLRPGLPVLVRTDDDSDLEKLQNAGATEVIPELIEGSLMLASHVLLVVGVPMRRVVRRITEAREQRYGLLRGYFRSIEDEESVPGDSLRLHSVRLDADAAGIGESLEILMPTGAQVQALRRRDSSTKLYKKIDFASDTEMQLGDVLVLQGNAEAIEKAERLLI